MCTLARLTSVLSIITLSNKAVKLTIPVRVVFSSIREILWSRFHLPIYMQFYYSRGGQWRLVIIQNEYYHIQKSNRQQDMHILEGQIYQYAPVFPGRMKYQILPFHYGKSVIF